MDLYLTGEESGYGRLRPEYCKQVESSNVIKANSLFAAMQRTHLGAGVSGARNRQYKDAA
jgi:hypothetical protein